MLDVQTEAVEASHKLEGWRGSSTHDLDRRGKFPAVRIFVECFEDGDPDGWNAARDGHTFRYEQSQDTFRVHIRAREHQACAEHGARERQAPGIGVEHGGNGQDGVELMQAKNFPQTASEGVQHESAVGVDDAFRTAGRPGSKTHGSAVVFLERRVLKIVACLGQQFFIVQEAFRDAAATVRHDNDFFEGGSVAKLFVHREKHIVDDEKAITGMVRDGRDFVGMEPQVERMQNAAGARHAEEGFEVARVIPHHRSDAVTGFHAKRR